MSASHLTGWTRQQLQALEEEILLAPHRLHESGIFSHENLIRMIDAHPAKDFSVNTMGDRPSKFEWREGTRNGVPADVLLDLVERGRLWINLRNVLKHHPACRDAVDSIYDELLATGVSPFRAEKPLVAMRRVCDEEPPAAHTLNPKIPEWLGRFIQRLMSKHAGARPQSAAEVAAADLLPAAQRTIATNGTPVPAPR